MRKIKRYASFALVACMGVSLLVNVPTGTVSAAEPDMSVEAIATGTDAETSESDFRWEGTKITGYYGDGGDVVIPSRCTELSLNGAFGDHSLTITSITIPASVTKISSLTPCSCLESIYVDEKNPVYDSRKNCNAIIETQTDTMIFACKNTVIPDGIKAISNGTFGQVYAFPRFGSGIKDITIPSSVESIGERAFVGCDLESISVDPENKVYDSRNGCNAIIESKTGKLIAGASKTVIPKGVTAIGNYAFDNRVSLRYISIPEGVTTIGENAFYSCEKLEKVEIAKGVKEIGYQAFCRCYALKDITVLQGVKTIGESAFELCQNITKINLPEGVETIKCWAFHECKALTGINIPDSVKTIESLVFENCGNLSNITIPSGVTKIGDDVFSGSAVKTIRGYAGSYAETYAKKNGYKFEDMTVVTVPTVTNVKATATGKNKVKVTWDKVSGATGYIVYARKNGKYAKLGVTAATSYTDTKALDNDYNFYFVYAYKKTATGKIVTGKCQKYAYAKGTCMAVTNLKASSVKGGVKLTWTKSAGADGYIVYGKKKNFKYGYIGMTTKNTATSYTDTKANKGSYNFYWVFPYHYDKNGKRVIGPICGYVYGRAK